MSQYLHYYMQKKPFNYQKMNNMHLVAAKKAAAIQVIYLCIAIDTAQFSATGTPTM